MGTQEIRNPKAETRTNSETRNPNNDWAFGIPWTSRSAGLGRGFELFLIIGQNMALTAGRQAEDCAGALQSDIDVRTNVFAANAVEKTGIVHDQQWLRV